MRVGFDATNILGHSGIRTYTRELVLALAAGFPGDEFVLFTTFSSSKKAVLQEFFGSYPNISIVAGLPHPRMLGESLKSITILTEAITWRIHGRKLDFVHLTDPYGTPALPGSFVATINDIFPITENQYRDSFLERVYLRRTPVLMKKARAIITPSGYVADTLHSRYPSCHLDIIPVHDAASAAFRPLEPDGEILKKYGVTENSYFLFVSRIDPRKNLPNLVEAYSRIPEAIREKNHLLLVLSGSEEDKEAFRTENKDFLKKSTVHTVEGVSEEDLIQLYSSSTAFVFPTFAEGFGLPVIEAMRCGCPVITSNVSCLPEIAGEAALLIDPYDPADLTDAMIAVVDPDGVRVQLISKGFEQAEMFSWDLTAKGTMDVYRKVLKVKQKREDFSPR